MSDGQIHTEQIKLFRYTVEKIERSLDEIFVSLERLNNKIDNVKNDSDMLIDGMPKHGVKPLRDEIEDVKNDVKLLKNFKDRIVWISAGVGAGSGAGVFGVLKLIFEL